MHLAVALYTGLIFSPAANSNDERRIFKSSERCKEGVQVDKAFQHILSFIIVMVDFDSGY